jgi:hypothetical protein
MVGSSAAGSGLLVDLWAKQMLKNSKSTKLKRRSRGRPATGRDPMIGVRADTKMIAAE